MRQRRRRLTAAAMARIAELCQQGLSTPAIAEQLGAPYMQVRGALIRLNLTPTSATGLGTRMKPALTGHVSSEQEQLISRFQASRLTVAQVAEQLDILPYKLSRELRGRGQMNPRRMRNLDKLLAGLGA